MCIFGANALSFLEDRYHATTELYVLLSQYFCGKRSQVQSFPISSGNPERLLLLAKR